MKLPPNPRFYDTSDDFFEQVTELIDEEPFDLRDIILGVAQRDKTHAAIIHVKMDEVGDGLNFNIPVWTGMIDEAFDKHVMRPWFIGLAFPVTALNYDQSVMCYEAVVTMERNVVRYGLLPLDHPEDGGHEVCGPSIPMMPGLIKSHVDQLVPAVRRHVVHQG